MHPQIENYLAQVSRQLKNLSAQQRNEEVQEIGQHLQALVAEGKEQGLSETAAVKTALAQFGSYRKVGRDLNQALRANDPSRLPKAFSAMTFVMIGQAVLTLLSYGVFAVPTNWNASIQATGGVAGLLWWLGQGLILSAVSIQIALLLRQVRPWAFWMALVFLGYRGVLGTYSLFGTIFASHQLQDLSGLHIAYLAATQIVFYLPTLFCLSVLVSNRRAYLSLARAKWST